MNSGFASVGTLPKQENKKVINPRATRYGLLPIWPLPTQARDFYVWEIPANQVFPFRPFIGEIGQDVYGNVTYTVERLPQDQILDMYTAAKFFVELEPLARLNDENKAQAIASVLMNPNECDKYPYESANACVTCWYKDSVTSMEDRIKLLDDAEMRKVARECAAILREGFSKALDEARRQLDEAVRDIDDPKSGKTAFYDQDYRNVYHTHSDRPQYKTSTSNANVGNQIAEAIRDLTRKDQAPQVDYAKLIAEAVDAATKDLRAELAAYKAKDETVTEAVEEAPKAKPAKK